MGKPHGTDTLADVSTDALIEELKRRIAKMDEARAALAALAGPASTPKTKVSEAKAAYWAAWHEYRAAHPSATVEEWRKSQKVRKGK